MGEELIYSIYLRRCDKLSEKASPVSNVVVLVILGQRQDVVTEKTSLFWSERTNFAARLTVCSFTMSLFGGRGGGGGGGI